MALKARVTKGRLYVAHRNGCIDELALVVPQTCSHWLGRSGRQVSMKRSVEGYLRYGAAALAVRAALVTTLSLRSARNHAEESALEDLGFCARTGSASR